MRVADNLTGYARFAGRRGFHCQPSEFAQIEIAEHIRNTIGQVLVRYGDVSGNRKSEPGVARRFDLKGYNDLLMGIRLVMPIDLNRNVFQNLIRRPELKPLNSPVEWQILPAQRLPCLLLV